MMKHCRVQAPFVRQRGFTLIEIMLVIVIIAAVSALVAPSFFSVAGRSLDEEVRRLRIVAQMAVEEAQLTGVPMRLIVRKDGYQFERLDAEGKWLPLEASPFHPCTLSPEFTMLFHTSSGDEGAGDDGKDDAVIGRLLLLPDGVAAGASITVSGGGDSMEIRFAPGPRSIQVDRGR